jgi:hypothetical protein
MNPINNDLLIDDLFESINPMDEKNWPSEIVSYAKQHLALENLEAINSVLMHNIIGLTSFFQKNNIKYLIYAGPSYLHDNLDKDPFYHYLLNDNNVLDLKNFSMLGLTGLRTHPTADGMQTIADYFINLLAEQE